MASTDTIPATGADIDRLDRLSFDAVYRQHERAVERWCTRLVGPGPDADDLKQEVFLVVNRRLASFRGEAKLSTWIFRITLRLAANQHRRRAVGRQLAHLTPELEQQVSSHDPTPLEQIERRERQVQVHDVLHRLRGPYRQALTMFELEARSTAEIAQALDVQVGNVWVLLHRARTAFSAQMTRLARAA